MSPTQFSLDPLPSFLTTWLLEIIAVIDEKCPGESPSVWTYRHQSQPFLHCEYEHFSLTFRFGHIELPVVSDICCKDAIELWVKDSVDAITLIAVIEQRRQGTPWPAIRYGVPNLDNQSIWEQMAEKQQRHSEALPAGA